MSAHRRSVPLTMPLLAIALALPYSHQVQGQTATKDAPKAEPKGDAGLRGSKVKPITDEECLKFAQEITEAMETKDFARYSRANDFDALLTTATAGIAASDEFRNGFSAGVKKSLLGDGSLFHRILAQTKNGGSYTFLHVHKRNNQKTALFRMILSNNAGINYHEYILARVPDGNIRSVDLYIHLSAETLSQTFRRFYVPAAAEASRNILSRLIGSEQELVKAFPKVRQMSKDLAERKFKDVLDTYTELPPAVQKDKTMLIFRMQAAQGVNDDAAYVATLKDFRTFHPQDPCVDMLSIDYYLLKQDYAESIACVDRLDKALGGDPYLEVIRAGIHRTAAKLDEPNKDEAATRKMNAELDEADKAIKHAIAQDPNLRQAQENQVEISLKRKKFDDTLAALKALNERFGIEFADLSTVPVYAEFVKSSQFDAWKDWLKRGEAKDKTEEKTETKKESAPPQQ